MTSDADALLIGDVGEDQVLAAIFPELPHSDAEIVGVGDDAAVLAAPDGRYVVTTDMMIHGPDFRLAWSTPFDLGWKAAASNLADVAAMGARPTALVIALAVPQHLTLRAVTDFARGIREACGALAPGCGVVGGDLSVSDVLTIAVTAFGDLEGRAPIQRSGATAGDVVALAGTAGYAAAGLALLFDRATDSAGEPNADAARRLRGAYPELINVQLAPEPPISLGVVAAVNGATSMLDVSDGLLRDAARIARASGVQVVLDAHSVRARAPRGFGEHALTGGEDHALLATFPANTDVPEGFYPIGRVVLGEGVAVEGDDDATDAPGSGWDPYTGWNGAAG